MRVLFLGDLAGTGFGTVTQDLGRAMIDAGHDLRFLSMNELGELSEPFKSRTLVVGNGDIQGWLSVQLPIESWFDGRAFDGWQPEAAILLSDFAGARMFVMRTEERMRLFSSIPVYHYVPVEGIDLPPRWAELWHVLRPVAMSEFGAEEIRKITGQRPPVVYHGVDTHQFRPLDVRDPIRLADGKPIRSKDEAKRAFNIPKHMRLIFRADRHMPRKRYPSMIRGLFPVIAQRPDVYVLIHCLEWDEGGSLYDTLSKVPAAFRNRYVVTDGHVHRDTLTVMYNAADLYVSTSAEGFGLTLAESLACGTPAVGIDYSAVPEVIGPGGVTVPVGSLIDNEYDHFWAGVNEKALGDTVGALLDDPSRRKALGRAGREHVLRSFQWRIAAQQFGDLMEQREAVAA